MLKALEITGFKSFADRTRLEFPAGVTVIVGPNGSGKSNVVDAIKWVLGEQSVRSLRGKEMIDVIFNGSSGRAPLNAAEVTLTFDNAARELAIDAPEVHVTRRVYRSGESEYLLNRQTCRLRDIRDLLAGTGVGNDGYSIIEQGRVDALLQSSSRERRVIFEEAAGINRFRLKKIEALRRLERVEQNLARLGDIVEELDARLKTMRNQAAKARRYKEMSDRLRALRTEAGLADWRRMRTELSAHEADRTTTSAERETLRQTLQEAEERLSAAEQRLSGAASETHRHESEAAALRGEILAAQSTIQVEWNKCQETIEEIERVARQAAVGRQRTDQLDHGRTTVAVELTTAERECTAVRRRQSEGETALSDVTRETQSLRIAAEQRRTRYQERARAHAALQHEISGLASRLESLAVDRRRAQQRLEDLSSARWRVAAEVASGQRLEAASTSVFEQQQQRTRAMTERMAAARRDSAQLGQRTAKLRQRLAAVDERISVLEDLERRREGYSQGAAWLVDQQRHATSGGQPQLHGVLASLCEVDLAHATAIEVALGELAGFVVVDDPTAVFSQLTRPGQQAPSRVGLLSARETRPHQTPDWALHVAKSLAEEPDLVAPAAQLVRAPAELQGLVERLLRDAWIVRDTAAALRLAAAWPQARWITPQGALVSDGGQTLVTEGAAGLGLISRLSELRALGVQRDALRVELAEAEAAQENAERELAAIEIHAAEVQQEQLHAQQALLDHRSTVRTAAERQRELERQYQELEAELSAAEAQHVTAAGELETARHRTAELVSEMTAIELEAADAARRLEELEKRRQEQSRQVIAGQIELAKQTARVDSLRQRLQQLDDERQERQRSLTDFQAQESVLAQRQRQAELRVLSIESWLAERAVALERLTVTLIVHRADLAAAQTDRERGSAQLQSLRTQLAKLEERHHRTELATGQLRLECNALVTRLRDDYGIDLAEIPVETPAELADRAATEQEIADLRRKLNHLGSVNLEALDELTSLETRHTRLSQQHQDLVQAKTSLLQVISRLNVDSRKLFTDTLDAVRRHFQTLFRKLFGGGYADIVLEPDVDVLEAGIEIVARPPGKDLPNISLYSGGERTLTSVALLLALFANRPSPFCVLDEVDANLDEANIERFIGVVKDFLIETQFLIITHSKKTMTCADTLYGVTMQESGVSMPMSVRFEDVSDNGEIRVASGGLGKQARAA